MRWLLMALAPVMMVSCNLADNRKRQSGLADDEVYVLLSTGDRQKELFRETVGFDRGEASDLTIKLMSEERYQTMDGFGAAVTGSSAFNLMKMGEENRTKFLEETFSDDGLGYSYVRISIGCSDFSLSEYSCCDTPGIENFALTSEEMDYVIPVLKEILAINPELKIMGSPWTPPKWMKVNNLKDLQPFDSWTSGQLNPAYYDDYAQYFVKWIKAFEAEGINIYSITPQNEPLNRGNSASMYMTWQEQRDFIRQSLGPALRDAGLKTKLYVFDHNYDYDLNKPENYDQGQYPLKIYEDAEAAGYITGAAYHNYGGRREELNVVHDGAPEKELVFTETSIGTWNDGRNLDVRLMDDMREVALGTVNNWCKGVIVWNLMLDTDRGPNRDGGCQTCYGAVDINPNDFATITRNSHYIVIGQMSSVVKPGAVRIGTSGDDAEGISTSAFENEDGSLALVVLNESAQSKSLTVDDGSRSFDYAVPGKSVVSFRW